MKEKLTLSVPSISALARGWEFNPKWDYLIIDFKWGNSNLEFLNLKFDHFKFGLGFDADSVIQKLDVSGEKDLPSILSDILYWKNNGVLMLIHNDSNGNIDPEAELIKQLHTQINYSSFISNVEKTSKLYDSEKKNKNTKKLIFRFTPSKVVGWDRWTENNLIYVYKDEKLNKYKVVVVDTDPFDAPDIHIPTPIKDSEYAIWFDDGNNKQEVFNLDAIFDYLFNHTEMISFMNNHKYIDDQTMAEVNKNTKTTSTENVTLNPIEEQPIVSSSTAHLPPNWGTLPSYRGTGFTETNLFFSEKFDVLKFLNEEASECTLKDVNYLVDYISKYYDDYEDQAIAIANKIISDRFFFKNNNEIAFTIIESTLNIELDDITKLGIKVIANNLDLDESVEFLKVLLKNLK